MSLRSEIVNGGLYELKQLETACALDSLFLSVMPENSSVSADGFSADCAGFSTVSSSLHVQAFACDESELAYCVSERDFSDVHFSVCGLFQALPKIERECGCVQRVEKRRGVLRSLCFARGAFFRL